MLRGCRVLFSDYVVWRLFVLTEDTLVQIENRKIKMKQEQMISGYNLMVKASVEQPFGCINLWLSEVLQSFGISAENDHFGASCSSDRVV